MAERRDAERTGQGAMRQLVLGLLLPALVAGLGWLGVQALDPDRWPIRAVRIEGELQRIDRERLQEVVAPLATTGLLLVNVDAVRRALEALPWIERAYVRRLWPDRLLLTVVEQQPVARWSDGRLVNDDGDLFAVGEDEQPAELAELPVLVGPQGQARRLLEQYRLLDGLLSRAGRQIARLELDPRRAWHLTLDGGLRVEIGRHAIRTRLERLLGLLLGWDAERLAAAERIDLRYTNGLAVRWQPSDAGDTARSMPRTEAGRT
ncbi:MAG: cell division protein FtsQ/DivIB [Gammaproteobacteria bacterium]|nr:cell division protein FtsQ/DivIB [Gammaproteobacteria bacterium]